MLLSDKTIRREIADGRIAINPYTEELVQPSSIDIRLGQIFLTFNNHRYDSIDPAVDQTDMVQKINIPSNETFVLHPGEFALAATHEFVGLPDDITARVEGKSSLGRLGLLTHATAGFVDAGFNGYITLELSNVANLPIKLYPGMKIGQLCFMRLDQPAENPYGSGSIGSHYQGQIGPTPSRSYQNFTKGF